MFMVAMATPGIFPCLTTYPVSTPPDGVPVAGPQQP
jgi:hypothetical protein